MFDVFTFMFFIVFFIIIVAIIGNLLKGIKQWLYNNEQPILDVKCRIVSKRSEVIGHGGANATHGSTYTDYYITFEVESNDRIELRVSGRDYGMIAEGDVGILKFKGTRYLEFRRES